MKKYHFTKKFEKQYAKLPPAKQNAVYSALDLYLDKPGEPKLRRHALAGKYAGQLSISAGGDLRIHLIENDDVIVVVICVGTHSQLYN